MRMRFEVEGIQVLLILLTDDTIALAGPPCRSPLLSRDNKSTRRVYDSKAVRSFRWPLLGLHNASHKSYLLDQ
jgi:hypothetical protein